MQIALVIILGGDLVRSTEHVGVGYLSAVLREHSHNVKIIEVTTLDKVYSYQELLKDHYDVIGFSTTCVNMSSVLQLAEQIRDRNKDVHIVCGGHMATFWGEKLLREYPAINSVVYGEGERPLLALVQALEKKQDLSQVPSLIYRTDGGEIVANTQCALLEDLDQLPFPDRDQFEQHDGKFQYIRISTSRGCLGQCGFCSSFVGRKQSGARWRGRSPQLVVDEIEAIVQKQNFHTFDFVDSTFEDPGRKGKERIRQIAEEILKRNLHIFYNCCFRAENWHDTPEDRATLDVLIRSGLEKVNIGFESGNERGLRILNKNATLEDNWRTIRLLADFPDIYITFGFIMLHPYSELTDLQDNADFLYNTGIGQVIRHYFWQLEVYPGTLMEEMLIRDQMLKHDYSIADGMYKYRFLNPEMGKFATLFRSLLEVTSVWDFEIFDILIHTFITRMRRKYQGTPVFDEVMSFSSYVNAVRQEMARFNYDFFCRLLGDQLGDLATAKSQLDEYIRAKMDQIKTEQYKLGLNLKRAGFELVYR